MELTKYEVEKVEAWRKRAGENLRLLRETIGVNQGEFASRMGVSRATLSAYELGSRTPDLNFINTVSLVTGCSTAYLLGQRAVMTDELVSLETTLGVDHRQAQKLKNWYLYAHLPTTEIIGDEGVYKAMLQINDVHELSMSRTDDERRQFLIWQTSKALERAVEKAVNVGIETWGVLDEVDTAQQELDTSEEGVPAEVQAIEDDPFINFRRMLWKQNG